jgi:hypothetical protein
MRMLFTVAALAGLAACASPKTPSRTMEELLADPAALQEVLDRCEANAARASGDLECGNARRAVAKKVADEDAARAAKQQAEFERLRAERRIKEDQQQQATDASKKPFDPYSSPVTTDVPATKKP